MAYIYEGERTRPVCTGRLAADDRVATPEQLCEVKVLLESYSIAVKMLRLCREDGRARQADAEESGLSLTYYGAVGGDEGYWLEQLRVVREFIERMPNRDCKMLLYYHYIRGLTVERAAEELDISRRGAFRLKKRALEYAAHLWAACSSDKQAGKESRADQSPSSSAAAL